MKYAIIGMGQFGRALASDLMKAGNEVTILDKVASIVTEMKDDVSFPLIGDATDIHVLRKIDMSDEDLRVVVAIGESVEQSILITAQLKELGVKYIYARAVSNLHSRVLQLIGVDGQFRVEDMAAKQLALRFENDRLMHMRQIDKSHMLAEIPVPDIWVGKRLQDVDLRSKYKLNLLTVRRGTSETSDVQNADVLATPDTPVIDFPEPDFVFETGDILVLFGLEKSLSRFAAHFGS